MMQPHDHDLILKTCHSYSTQAPRYAAPLDNNCKSDAYLSTSRESTDVSICIRERVKNTRTSNVSHGEYYKKYEHDEVPVKDANYNDFKARGDKESITNSELDKLEMKVFNDVSQDFQKDNSSFSSLESNIKFFKTTVQEIFDNFYASMQDFELYKKRFHDILAKNREDALVDMEDFIKDMIQHIMSSESCSSSDSRNTNEQCCLEVQDKQTHVNNVTDDSSTEMNTSSETNGTPDENIDALLQTYRNDNYLTDSTLDEKASNEKRYAKKEEIFNIFLLTGSPYVQIKINERNILSEINIKAPSASETESNHVASAENLKKLAAKKDELDKYAKKQQNCNEQNCNVLDREIPVKISNAKKDIHMNEEFSQEREAEKSFIYRICSFLCKKIRKPQFN